MFVLLMTFFIFIEAMGNNRQARRRNESKIKTSKEGEDKREHETKRQDKARGQTQGQESNS